MTPKPAFTVQICSNVCPHVLNEKFKNILTEIREIHLSEGWVDIHDPRLSEPPDRKEKNRNAALDKAILSFQTRSLSITPQNETRKNRYRTLDPVILASQAPSPSSTPLPTPSNSPSIFPLLCASEARTESSSSNSRPRSYSVISINQDERKEEVIFHRGRTILKSDPNFIALKPPQEPDPQIEEMIFIRGRAIPHLTHIPDSQKGENDFITQTWGKNKIHLHLEMTMGD